MEGQGRRGPYPSRSRGDIPNNLTVGEGLRPAPTTLLGIISDLLHKVIHDDV